MKVLRSAQDRVEFFSKNDGAWPYMLEKAEALLNDPPNAEELDLNLLLEFQHIKQHFEHDLFLPKWTEETRSAYKATTEQFIGHAQKYFLGFQRENLMTEIGTLEFSNRKNFWKLFSYFEIYKKFDRTIILEILEAEPIHIRYILKVKALVQHYNNELRTILLEDAHSAELLLSHFEEKQDNTAVEYHFPKSLSDLDKQQIIVRYLDSEEPNPNFVDLIRKSQSFKLTPKILLKAKQTDEALKDKYFSEESSTVISVEGGLNMLQTEPVLYESTGKATKITYGGAYFDTLNSDIELFSIFSDIFLYTNEEELIELVNKDSEMDNFERTLMRSKNEYYAGIVFSRKDMLSTIQLQLFEVYLKKKERTIESFLESFFQLFFKDRQGMDNLEFKLPQADAAQGDKIRMLAPELEYLLKQYRCYVTEGEINHELLQMDSAPGYLSEVPSLVSGKYISSDHPEIKKLQYYFFEPYSMLARAEGKSSAKTLYKILRNEGLLFSTLESYQKDFALHLQQEGFLTINEDTIEIADLTLVYIAGLLRKNSSMNYWRHPLALRLKMDQLVNDGLLLTSNQLFTLEECNYINYYLNKKEFSNGYDLRNKYLHGTNNRSLKNQEADYRKFLRIVILILLRLKEDMELSAALR
ncbi:hypothetical protein [Pedobacter polysacchareus]|uniref:hypothetical protein n=1 Tax=Pedobacter polysacchareus TaxID=2861973 RepID=UPI001C992D89|nr:hypothetical protein [Pedobacter polysacchareus]